MWPRRAGLRLRRLMSLTIELAPMEEQHLAEQAARQGVPVTDYVRSLIWSNIESATREAKARHAQSVLRSWIDEAQVGSSDEQAQREAQQWEEAARSVDEDRLSYRRRFPNLMPDAGPGTSP